MTRPFSRLLAAVAAAAAILLSGCTPDGPGLIDDAIAAHGGARFDNVQLRFEFRDRTYFLHNQTGRFRYERTFRDSLGQVRDVLDNDGFRREVEGRPVPLSPADSQKYANSLNSVAWFALLPYPLKAPAVKPRYLGERTIRGETYHEVEVTFDPNGGGVDYQDRFVFWFHHSRRTMDYLAYRFHTDGGGTRFREAVNVRRQQGLRIADYRNYTVADTDMPLERYPERLEAGSLELVSVVAKENLQVTMLPGAVSP